MTNNLGKLRYAKNINWNDYEYTYSQLKEKYARRLIQNWTECTDPQKFVHEDLGIASYLLLLWKDHKGPCTFIDLGCGNGLLVYVLTQEGHIGVGYDVRKRKIWDTYPESTVLKEETVIPSSTSVYPEADWLIGNHSDELTIWLPIMAARSSRKCQFFTIPCCPYEFNGDKFRRRNTNLSVYQDFLEHVQGIGEKCGFEMSSEKLKIPSTKRICLIGKRRNLDDHSYHKLNEEISNILEMECPNNSMKLQHGEDWIKNFKPRVAKEPVRNCSQIPREVQTKILKQTQDILLSSSRYLLLESGGQWNQGQNLEVRQIAEALEPELLNKLKSECKGLQTLLKNHHQIFLIRSGMAELRSPESLLANSEIVKNRKDFKWKQKPCWFHSNHPDGCPIAEIPHRSLYLVPTSGDIFESVHVLSTNPLLRKGFVFSPSKKSTAIQRRYESLLFVTPCLLIYAQSLSYGMRQMTLSQNQFRNGGGNRQCSGIDTSASQRVQGRYGAARSLDLLRRNIQNLVNRDIDALLKSYLQKYFQPAVANIKKNLGEDSITEHSLRVVCIEMLEDAKAQYIVRTPIETAVESVVNSTNPFQANKYGQPIQQLPKISSSADCTPPAYSALQPKYKYLPIKPNNLSYRRLESDSDTNRGRKKIMKTVTSVLPGTPTPIKLVKLESVRREGPKWDPNRINSSTLFIMGARANKVLGFGQTRGRLYTKHPELVKYSGDTEDKEWLSRNNLMPPTGGIAYLLILNDIRELAMSSDYRNNPNVLLHELRGFLAPDFMLVKIRAFIAQARTEEVEDNSYQHYDPCSFLQGLTFSGATAEMSPTISNSNSSVVNSAPTQEPGSITFPQLSFNSSYTDQLQYF